MGKKAEQYKARIAILEQDKSRAEDILSKRKRSESGTWMFLRGQHFVSWEEVVGKIENHEMIIAGHKRKMAKRTTKKEMNTDETEGEEEQEVELLDSIVVEPYSE